MPIQTLKERTVIESHLLLKTCRWNTTNEMKFYHFYSEKKSSNRLDQGAVNATKNKFEMMWLPAPRIYQGQNNNIAMEVFVQKFWKGRKVNVDESARATAKI